MTRILAGVFIGITLALLYGQVPSWQAIKKMTETMIETMTDNIQAPRTAKDEHEAGVAGTVPAAGSITELLTKPVAVQVAREKPTQPVSTSDAQISDLPVSSGRRSMEEDWLTTTASDFPTPITHASKIPVADDFQTVWVPFRSERSATGFADKLSKQLQRQFKVVRQGPGKYQVGFIAASTNDRNEVLEGIENLTGYRLQTAQVTNQ